MKDIGATRQLVWWLVHVASKGKMQIDLPFDFLPEVPNEVVINLYQHNDRLTISVWEDTDAEV